LVFKKKELEHLPLRKPWDHAIETKSGFQPKKSKVYALSPNEPGGSRQFLINEQLRKGSIMMIKITTKPCQYFFVPKKDHKTKNVHRLLLSK